MVVDKPCDLAILSMHETTRISVDLCALASAGMGSGRNALPPQGLHDVLAVQVPARTEATRSMSTRTNAVHTRDKRAWLLHGVLDGFAGSGGGQEVVDGHLLVLVLLVWNLASRKQNNHTVS
jgi:hypothetical protein